MLVEVTTMLMLMICRPCRNIAPAHNDELYRYHEHHSYCTPFVAPCVDSVVAVDVVIVDDVCTPA